MNKAKVETLRHSELLAKLGEEFGEVCQRYGQILESDNARTAFFRRIQLIEELGHVMLVAEVWRKKAIKVNEAEKLAIKMIETLRGT